MSQFSDDHGTGVRVPFEWTRFWGAREISNSNKENTYSYVNIGCSIVNKSMIANVPVNDEQNRDDCCSLLCSESRTGKESQQVEWRSSKVAARLKFVSTR